MIQRLVTHKDCMDGSTCAILFRILYPDGIIEFIDPQQVDEVSDRDAFATIFADMCPSYVRNNEHVFDHHKTSIGKVTTNNGTVDIDVCRCGCKIFYDNITKLSAQNSEQLSKLDMLCEIVDDYDRFLLKRPVSKELALIHEFVGQDKFVSIMVGHVLNGTYCSGMDYTVMPYDMWGIVSYLKNNQKKYVEEMAKNSWVTDIYCDGNTYSISFAYAECEVNMLAQHLLEKNGTMMSGIINLKKNKISLRSNNELVDCSAIASYFGGGGHASAAGFTIPPDIRAELRGCIV